ncbi:MAG: tetratricopeptide repeat protein [Alphaproteobacteria bacterium]|nr:tetratricopeptide repeat protein [Alphaproteobacteria bacterium]
MADMPLAGGDDNEPDQPLETNAAAIAIALDGAKDDPKLSSYIAEFLAEQRALISDQRLHLEEQVKRLKLTIIDERLSIALKAMTAAVGLAIVMALATAIWYAAHDNGLVIEAFSVPPDMVARGLTGQAIAAQLQDKLAAMQNATKSARPAESYANNWGDDIKVQIPETGVSIGEFYNLLVTWLGRETHITGEIFHTANGIAVTARGGGDGGALVTGSEADLDKLLQQTAEKIYERTQPYRYAIYLQSETPPQMARSRQILEGLAQSGSPRDRAWAYNGLAVLDNEAGDGERSVADARQALAFMPDFALAYENIDQSEANLGHDEASLAAARSAVDVLRQGSNVDMSALARQVALPQEQETVDSALDDFAAVRSSAERMIALPDYNGSVENGHQALVIALAMLHDGAATRRTMRNLPPATDQQTQVNRTLGEFIADYWLGEWSSVVSQHAGIESLLRKGLAAVGASPSYANVLLARQLWPYVASAMAELGDFKEAHALIDQSPLDCYACVRAHADIDAAEKNWSGAAAWFALAVKQAPSIPMGYYRWGRMLMAKGDYDGAIAKFETAHDKGPHFADPLEAWGEALIARNRSDLALAKFAEADKDAPNWGRLHLKWGEALLWAGRRGDAAKQFAAAAKLDLNTSERAQLVQVSHG